MHVCAFIPQSAIFVSDPCTCIFTFINGITVVSEWNMFLFSHDLFLTGFCPRQVTTDNLRWWLVTYEHKLNHIIAVLVVSYNIVAIIFIQDNDSLVNISMYSSVVVIFAFSKCFRAGYFTFSQLKFKVNKGINLWNLCFKIKTKTYLVFISVVTIQSACHC